MENEPVIVPQPPQAPVAAICPMCHEPVLPTYYFCPNCGTKLAGGKPLSTSIATQLWIYLFSLILPAIAFLAIKYWPGVKYLRSPDWEKKQIGIVAIVLMAVSTIALAWWGIVWFEGYVQSISGGLIPGF
jgi:zinc ribbon protein